MDEEKKKTTTRKKTNSTKKTTGTKKKTSTSKKNSTKSSSVKSNTKKNTSKKASTSKSKTTSVKKKSTNTKKVSGTKKKTTSTKKKVVNKETPKKQEEVKAEEKKTNKKTKILLDIIIYVFIVVVMICLVLLYFKRREDTETIKEIEETVVPKEIEIVDEKTVKDYISDLQIKFNNSDIKGILNIDGLDVSIPIVKGKDNNYYLKHAVNKKKSVIGSVFIDYRNNTNSKQINIYGHNSTKFNPPFKVLEGYLNKDYYNEHKYFEFMVNDETRKYEIFSVIVANKDSSEEHMQFSYKKDSDWLKHFQRLQKKSKYKINVTVNKNDKIIVLQTCIFGRYHDKLLVIVGKEIERK
ncbi:MAG: class B sortase [Mollicutes bacterium]|nr:class B sortase [Mollicutes bacterium]